MLFADATGQLFDDGFRTFVEISPNPVALMGMMNTAFASGKADAQLLYTTKRKVDELESLLDLAAKLYVNGMPVDFGVFYGPGEAIAAPSQINQMIRNAIENCERFYPCFQLACWGDASPEAAMDIALAEAYGRA